MAVNKLAQADPRYYESPLKRMLNESGVLLLKAISLLPF